MGVFIPFLEKYAKRIYGEKPEWTRWIEETGTKVWTEANHLEEEGKIIITGGDMNRVQLCYYYAEQIKEAYRNADEDSIMPFPDEESLKITIPPEQLKPLDIRMDLPRYLEEPQEEMVPIIKLVFANDRGSALVIAPMIPLTLLEFSLLKVRNYLLRHGNKEYIQHKLAPQFTGREEHLREILDQIMIRPSDCLNDLKNGREVSFYFWASFCNLVRIDLNQKNELLPEEIGAIQAVSIIEVCSSFFKNRTTKTKEIELAFKNFELELEKPPYYFSRDAITRFKDNKGVPLLGQYTQAGLDAYIKKRVTEPVTPNELPDLLYFYTDDGASWLVKKTKLLSLCVRLLAEARLIIIKIISKRWKKLLKDFRRENAMDDDREFERLIASYVDEYAPVLKALLGDRKLYLVHEEMKNSKRSIPESSRLFDRDELLPLRVLLLLKRRQLLSDTKLLMPFWYTLPIISQLAAFFMNLWKKKKVTRDEKEVYKEKEDPMRERLRNTALEAKVHLVPENQTLDSYLDELSSRWRKLLNKQAWDNLVEDVNSLIRDRLRNILRIQKHNTVNRSTLDKLTTSIINSSAGLQKISDQKALFLYIKVYLVKLFISKSVM
ncbi:hypothetical protein AGMMS50230_04000 [Spirochaetia bacterium]|nr:hypothetical protein AGMMS50230_04000 [Spirochaetia bacterium]